jgi:hypothetical protein
MSWEKQERLPNGRFGSKKVEATKKVPKRVKKVKSQFINILLDRSMSMSSVKYETQLGFNKIVRDTHETAVKEKVKTYWGFSEFGNPYNESYMFSTEHLSPIKYNPQDTSTALYDGIGYIIKQIDHYLTQVPEDTNVVLIIQTDGEENSSKKHSAEGIKALIEDRRNKGWNISFVGAGDFTSVEKVSTSLGIFSSNTLSYTGDRFGTTTAFNRMSDATANYTRSVSKGETKNIDFFGT